MTELCVAPAPDPPTRRSTVGAFSAFAVVVAGVLTAIVASRVAGLTYAQLVDNFIVTNLAIGLSCGVAGVLLAGQRPRNRLGWLLLAAALSQTITGAAAPLVIRGAQVGWSEPVQQTLETAFAYAWPWSIALLLPMALLVFPDGLLPGRFWRATAWFAVLTSPVFVAEVGADPVQEVDGRIIRPWLVLANHADLAPLWTVKEVAILAVFVVAVVGLVLRYRRGDEQRRRQLLWLVLALLLTIVVLVPWGLFSAGPILQLLVIALVPAAMTVAVLRHQLLDIRLVLSRALVYALLTGGVVGVYLGLVAGADLLLRPVTGSVLATLVIAVGFNPVRVRLQRVVDRALYGDRADPVRALSRIGERLSAADGSGADDVLTVLGDALRLPYVALRHIGSGEEERPPPAAVETITLRYQGEQVGELVVGVRRGQRALDPADRAALELLAVPLSAAVHATALSVAVQRSREQIVAAREEERRRLRRDLHDGLGPALTGIAFQADAAGNLLGADPARAGELLRDLRGAATEAINDVRRLVYALRPPALDELGLVGALRRHVEQLDGGPAAVTVDAADPLPTLPAAVEVAAYRIVVEAVTNALRHARPSRVDVRVGCCLRSPPTLELAVDDDGAGALRWAPGVGLTSMRERVAELGGTLSAGPASGGGRVSARLPL